jgi:uncharacterized membrane protein YhiD involved in acid resistance
MDFLQQPHVEIDLPFVDIALALKSLASIAMAFLLALPFGWEREQSERTAGLRPFPLVAMASCGYILLAIKVLGSHPDGAVAAFAIRPPAAF